MNNKKTQLTPNFNGDCFPPISFDFMYDGYCEQICKMPNLTFPDGILINKIDDTLKEIQKSSKFYINLYKKHYQTTAEPSYLELLHFLYDKSITKRGKTMSNSFYVVCDVTEELVNLKSTFSAYDIKVKANEYEPELKIQLKEVKKIVRDLYKNKSPIFTNYESKMKDVNKGDKTVKALFYCPKVDVNPCMGCSVGHSSCEECDYCYDGSDTQEGIDDILNRNYPSKIEWVEDDEPDDDEPTLDCYCDCCSPKSSKSVQVNFEVEDPDAMVVSFEEVSAKLKAALNDLTEKADLVKFDFEVADPDEFVDYLKEVSSKLRPPADDKIKEVSKNFWKLPAYGKIKEVLTKLVEEKKNFSAYELKKEVVKAYPELKLTTKTVRYILDQLYYTTGEVLSDYSRSRHFVTKGDKRVKVLFYYPGFRGLKKGMTYVVPTIDSTVSGDKLKPSLIGGEEEVLYSNEESKCSKELYARLESLESHNEKLNDLDKTLRTVLSSPKVIWVLNTILKALDTKEKLESKFKKVYSNIKGFYS